MKDLNLKYNLKHAVALAILTLFFGTGCVMTPAGDIIPAPVDVDVEAGVDFGPRVHVGSRSAVTVWLHPQYYTYDAYPIAQRHCSRWGMFARPRSNWSYSAGAARYLDYTCVRRRPHLAYPHLRRRGSYGHKKRPSYRQKKHPRSRRVYTPKPLPRVKPVKRRGTFGRTYNPPASQHRRSTVIERGKPWEHNRNKKRVLVAPSHPKRGRTVERGKPWEHNTRKNKKTVIIPSKRVKGAPVKRSTFGSLKTKTVDEKRTITKKTKFKDFGSLKKKKGPVKRKTLSL